MNGAPAAFAIGWVAAEVGVPTAPAMREHLVFLQQLLDRFDRFGRLVAVVDALEFELAALDAAGLVDFRERRFEAHFHALAQRRGRTFQRGRLTEHDLVGGDTIRRTTVHVSFADFRQSFILIQLNKGFLIISVRHPSLASASSRAIFGD